MEHILPETISNEMFHLTMSAETSASIDRIAKEYGLSEDKVFELSAAIGFAAVGSLPLKNLSEALQESVGIAKESARTMALAVILEVFYPYWPLFSDIDEVIVALGGKAPSVKPAMPRAVDKPSAEALNELGVAYPEISRQEAGGQELFGGLEVPMPPAPLISKTTSIRSASATTRGDVLERDVPWSPPTSSNRPPTMNSRFAAGRNVARPGDVEKLLEKKPIVAADDQALAPDTTPSRLDATRDAVPQEEPMAAKIYATYIPQPGSPLNEVIRTASGVTIAAPEAQQMRDLGLTNDELRLLPELDVRLAQSIVASDEDTFMGMATMGSRAPGYVQYRALGLARMFAAKFPSWRRMDEDDGVRFYPPLPASRPEGAHTVARPNDVATLLEKNLLRKDE